MYVDTNVISDRELPYQPIFDGPSKSEYKANVYREVNDFLPASYRLSNHTRLSHLEGNFRFLHWKMTSLTAPLERNIHACWYVTPTLSFLMSSSCKVETKIGSQGDK